MIKMDQVILYKQDDGHIAIVVPTPQALTIWPIDEIAKADVPVGKPFKIVNVADLPSGDQIDWHIPYNAFSDGVGTFVGSPVPTPP